MGGPSLLHRLGEYSATAVAPGELTSLSQEVDGEGVLVNCCLQDLSLQAGHCVPLLKTCTPAVLSTNARSIDGWSTGGYGFFK